MKTRNPKPIATPLTIKEKKEYFTKKNPNVDKLIATFDLEVKKKF